jgi:hypothetical protein
LPNGLSFVGVSNGATITISGAAGTYSAGSITVRAMSSSCSGAPSASTQDVTVVAIPATPGPITFSSTEICGVGTTFTAGVTPVAGATSYEWTLPNGLSFVGASNGATITISGAAGTYSAGSITVRAMSSSCGGATSTSTQTVTVIAIPATPGPITFSGTSFCGASTFTAGVTAVAGATSYVWTLPTGLSFVGAADGATITISGAVGTYPTGSISVQAVNSFCNSTPRASTQEIVINGRPAAPTNPSSNVGKIGNSIAFSATPPADCTIDWYDAATGGTKKQTGVNSFSEALASTKTYYAESRNSSTGCVSASRLAVSGAVTISGCNNPPVTPLITSDNVAFGSTVETTTASGLIFSAPVRTVNLPPKSDFNPSQGNAVLDYRDHTEDRDIYGDLFSWCMVAHYADVLCPTPWHLPTTADFVAYYNAEPAGTVKAGMHGWLLGGRAQGSSPDFFGVRGYYWAANESLSGTHAAAAATLAEYVPFAAEGGMERYRGASVRCVK